MFLDDEGGAPEVGQVPSFLEIVVLRPEELGHDLGDERLDLAQDDPLDAGIEDERARGDARPATHDQHGLGLSVEQRGQVAQHPDQGHEPPGGAVVQAQVAEDVCQDTGEL